MKPASHALRTWDHCATVPATHTRAPLLPWPRASTPNGDLDHGPLEQVLLWPWSGWHKSAWGARLRARNGVPRAVCAPVLPPPSLSSHLLHAHTCTRCPRCPCAPGQWRLLVDVRVCVGSGGDRRSGRGAAHTVRRRRRKSSGVSRRQSAEASVAAAATAHRHVNHPIPAELGREAMAGPHNAPLAPSKQVLPPPITDTRPQTSPPAHLAVSGPARTQPTANARSCVPRQRRRVCACAVCLVRGCGDWVWNGCERPGAVAAGARAHVCVLGAVCGARRRPSVGVHTKACLCCERCGERGGLRVQRLIGVMM